MNRLYVLDGPEKGQAFELESDTICHVGRSSGNHVQLSDAYVSRRHLKVIRRGERYFVEDLNSRNGTSVDGELIEPGVELELTEGIPIVIGVSVI